MTEWPYAIVAELCNMFKCPQFSLTLFLLRTYTNILNVTRESDKLILCEQILAAYQQ